MDTPAHIHLIIGGFAFGAVFMTTDPVTATQTNKGKVIYGLLIGFFAIVIRIFNPAYPEGMMLAILLMNVFAPLIDHYVIGSNVKRRLSRIKNKIMNVDKNSYTFSFAIVMVIVVAGLLSFTAINLKKPQLKNIELEKKQNILSSIGIDVERNKQDLILKIYQGKNSIKFFWRRSQRRCF